MTTLLLTGLPRSGTTLMCALLSRLPNTIALAEPMSIGTATSVPEVLRNLDAFVSQVRQDALARGMVPAKVISGQIIDNFMEAPKAAGELRRVVSRVEEIPVGKRLKHDFRLYIKQPALFAAISGFLASSMHLYALVRSPLDVLASWQTVDLPVHHGRLPAAERVDEELRETLHALPDRMDRQVAIMGWFLRRFAQLPHGRVIRYEDLVANPAATLSAMQPAGDGIRHDIHRQSAKERYPAVDLAELARRLEPIAPLADPFYPGFRETLQQVQTGAPAVLRSPGPNGRKRIDFLIGGAQKGGTTALAGLLDRHPSVRMANRKEVHFFDDGGQDWTHPDYGSFHCWFRPVKPGAPVYGEATPVYLFLPEALHRIHRYNPAIRFVICLRHPTFRAHSQWRMETARGDETLSFAEAISPAGRERQLLGDREARLFSYLERGLYGRQLRQLFALFPRENVHILRTDRLWQDSAGCLADICRFLGIEPMTGAETPEYRVPIDTRHIGHIAVPERQQLDRFFRSTIEETQALTGLDLSDWLDPDYQEPMAPPEAAGEPR